MDNTPTVKENLRQILAEWHSHEIPAMVTRGFGKQSLKNTRILSIIGPRRAGKTFVCFEIIADLLKNGIPRQNVIYINFEDERLWPLTGKELTFLLDIQEELFGVSAHHPRYCFIDEVQNVPHWSKWVRRITDQNQTLSVIITGSSSKMLSTEIATELRGRGASLAVFPYSFGEFVRARGVDAAYSGKLFYSSRKNSLKRLCNDFFERGGFPEVSLRDDYHDVLQLYYRTMFARDMVERFSVKNIRLFEDFLKIQMTRFASLNSISNVEKELLSFGYTLSKNTLTAYMGYARDVFLFFEVNRFDSKITVQLRNPRKLYAIDHGLVNAVRFRTSEDFGRILENAAFIELYRRNNRLFYHAGERECDFIIQSGPGIAAAVQVCWSLENSATREREIKGLLSAMEKYKLKKGTILTMDTHGDLEQEGKKIRIRPFWLFALGPQDFDT